MFSSVRQGVFFYSSRGIDGFVKESFFAQLPQRGFLLNRRKGAFCSIAARACRFALAQAARAFHFFCPNKRNETKKIRRLLFLGYSGTFLR